MVWNEYHTLLTELLKAQDYLPREQISVVIQFAENKNLILLEQMNQLTYEWEKIAEARAGNVRLIQWSAIVVACLNFVLLWGYYLKQLHERNQVVMQYSEEAENMINHLQRHIFQSDERQKALHTVVHDIRNPASAIYGLAEVIRGGDVEIAMYEPFARQIRVASEHILHFTQKVLRENRYVVMPVQCNLIAHVRQVMEEYQARAIEKNIRIDLYTSEPSLLYAYIDERAFLRVMQHLVENALKFTYPDTSVTIDLRRMSDTNTIQLRIGDEGPGIPESERHLLFQRFVRLSSRPTAEEYATGLGLSITYQLLHLLNGRIWHEPKQGNGATFVVELPLEMPKNETS
jgi:two-component system, sensor histidine kinase and response regulator